MPCQYYVPTHCFTSADGISAGNAGVDPVKKIIAANVNLACYTMSR